jgi:hypothetical protein
MKNGSVLLRDQASAKKIAREAVRRVYQHTSSWVRARATRRQLEVLDQRDALAERFRREYGAANGAESNVYPHFIGVFDTVASLSNPIALAGLIAVTPFLTAIVSAIGWWGLSFFFGISVSWWILFLALTVAVVVLGYLANVATRVRVAFGLKDHPWYRTLHLTEARMNFYDRTLNPNVGFARHALSIDEARDSFQRVPWGQPGAPRQTTPEWFEQIWFAGNHADIGGSYPENEARLSDIAMKWMLDAAVSVGLKHDPSLLHLYPDPTGPQHDETRSSVFKYAGKRVRTIGPDFPLHESVIARLNAGKVLNYDRYEDYRPANLRDHKDAKGLYG